MSVSQLPNGKWRAQTYDPATGKFVSSAKILGLAVASFAREKDARRADAKAAETLAARRPQALTLAAWAETWTTSPLYERNKESTNAHNRERIRRFVEKYGDVSLSDFEGERGDHIVGEWVGLGNLSTVPVLKAMFNDACSAKAGRKLRSNPFVGVDTKKGKGRAHDDPPTEEQVAEMLEHAYQITAPGFAAWLKVAAWSGMRPGELDAMRWDWVDFKAGRIDVQEQWNVKIGKLTLPKNDKTRVILLTPQAREALMRAPKESAFCFTNLHGNHWTTSSRSHHWDRVRAVMGWLPKESRKCLYLATRHFAGWYFYNVLELPAEDVAIQLGHEDGGLLVRQLYGHRDRVRTLARIEAAFAAQARKDGLAGQGLRAVDGSGA